MAVLCAYLDESGIDTESPVSAVGGYVATEEDWAKFSDRWRGMLSDFGVSELHMKYCEELRGEFSGWERETKEGFLRSAVTILNETPALGRVCIFRRGVPEARTGPAWPFLDKPYTLGFTHSVIQALDAARGFIGADEKVAFIFGRQDEWKHTALRLYDGFKNVRDFEQRHRLGSISFESSKDFVPLQAADFLDYELRKLGLSSLPDSGRPIRRTLEMLLAHGRVRGCLHDKEDVEAKLPPLVKRWIMDTWKRKRRKRRSG